MTVIEYLRYPRETRDTFTANDYNFYRLFDAYKAKLRSKT